MEKSVNNSFSFARMWQFLWSNVCINRKAFLLGVGAVFIFLNASYWLILTSNWIAIEGGSVGLIETVFLGILCLSIGGWFMLVANLFSDYHKKGFVGRTLLLPVSQTEQWTSRVLFSWISLIVIVVIEILILCIWVLANNSFELLVLNIDSWIQKICNNLLQLQFMSMLFYCWSLFLCVGTLMARRRILISMVVLAVLNYFISYFIYSFYDQFVGDGYVQLSYFSDARNAIAYTQIAFALFFIAFSYIRFKRLQTNQ